MFVDHSANPHLVFKSGRWQLTKAGRAARAAKEKREREAEEARERFRAELAEGYARVAAEQAQLRERAKQRAHKRRAALTGADATLTPEEWERIKAAWDYRCAYCGGRAHRLTMDHVIPIVKGGPHSADNVVPACASCNCRKCDRPAPPFVVVPKSIEGE